MKFFLFSLCLTCSIVTFSQGSFSEADAKGIIDTFFEGFHKGDTTKLRLVMHSNIKMQTAFTCSEGNHQILDTEMNDLLKAISER